MARYWSGGFERRHCPYRNEDGSPCGFEGTDKEVDDHRSEAVRPGGEHSDQPQAGSNLQ